MQPNLNVISLAQGQFRFVPIRAAPPTTTPQASGPPFTAPPATEVWAPRGACQEARQGHWAIVSWSAAEGSLSQGAALGGGQKGTWDARYDRR